AVVGTRRPTDHGRRVAARLGSAFARAGALVVSGLAIGIDGAAHAAVVAERGRTVAVIGGGHDRLFPRSHDRLADAIVEAGGAIVSEHPPGTEPAKGTFPRRNRIISGLSDAVVVVEAPASSGALITAKWALEQGRAAYFVPGAIDAQQSAGCLAWLREFPVEARIVAGIPQLLDDLGLAGGAAFPALCQGSPEGSAPEASTPSRGLRPPRRAVRPPSMAARRLQLTPTEDQIAVALLAGASTVDELVAVTGMTVAAVLGTLTQLEATGLATGAYGRYQPAGFLETSERGTARDPAA
ncbi:MAG: DNA-processing protein DprA, partial [Candidatus Limnocylindrales bacterium]